VYQLPRPDQRHHRPGRRGVVHAAVRRTVSGAASCATPRPKLIQPSPRPRRCIFVLPGLHCLSGCQSSHGQPPYPIAPGRASVHGDPGRGRFGSRTPRQTTETRQSPRWRSPRLPGPPVTASGQALIVTTTGRRTPTGSHHADGCPPERVCAGELHVVTVSSLPGETAAQSALSARRHGRGSPAPARPAGRPGSTYRRVRAVLIWPPAVQRELGTRTSASRLFCKTLSLQYLNVLVQTRTYREGPTRGMPRY
jgi:hypothetical protein